MTSPKEILRTSTYALQVEPGWRVLDSTGDGAAVAATAGAGADSGGVANNDALILQNGDHEDERLIVTSLPPGLPLDSLAVELMRDDWSRAGGLPPLPQRERLGGREVWTCTWDRQRHRLTTATLHVKTATFAAVCTARLERFPDVWPAARRMLASVVEPTAVPNKPTGRLTAGLGGLTETWLQKLMDMLKAELKQKSLEATFEGDRLIVGDASVPVDELARQCRGAHGYEYGGLVRRFVEAHLATLSGAPAEAGELDAVRDRLVFRLYKPGAERSRDEVCRTDLEGISTCLALDLPADFEPVSPARAAAWGLSTDELFAIARRNLAQRRVELRRQPLRDGEMALLSQPVIGASYALVLDQYPACVGRRGAFVGVPVREATLVLPFDDDIALTLLLDGFYQAVRDMHGRDPYGVSPTVFYFDRSAFEPVGISETDGVFTITAGPRLAPHVRKARPPKTVEVVARDSAGQSLWGAVAQAAPGEAPPKSDLDFLREAEAARTDRPQTNADVLRVLVKRAYDTDLPYTLKGLEALDRVLEAHFDAAARAALPPAVLDLIASFFGHVMILTQGGEWTRQSRSALGWGLAFGPPKMGLVRKPDGPVVDIRLRTRQSLQGGEKLASVYWSLQYDIAQMRRG